MEVKADLLFGVVFPRHLHEALAMNTRLSGLLLLTGITILSVALLTAVETQPGAQVTAAQHPTKELSPAKPIIGEPVDFQVLNGEVERIWTLKTGKKIAGVYVSSGTTTLFVRNEGDDVFLEISELSSDDQAYVAKLQDLKMHAPASQLKERPELNRNEPHPRVLGRTWKTVFGVSVFVTLLLLVPMLPSSKRGPFRALTNKGRGLNAATSKSQCSSTGNGAKTGTGNARPACNSSDSDPLASQIRSKVESLTRLLDVGELSIRPVAKQILPVQLVVEHSATFSSEGSVGKGQLPSNVEAIDSPASMVRILQQRLKDTEQEAEARLDAWAQAAEDYRGTLAPWVCMRPTGIVGVQTVCSTCQGEQRLVCSNCNGRRRVTCGGCGGRGKVNCLACHGLQSVYCWSCSGRGYHEKAEYELSISDRQSTMNQQHQVIRRVPCSACGARGSNKCNTCFDGTVNCSNGGGNGQIGCPECHAQGTIPYAACAATGVVHRTGWIQCAVNRCNRIGVASSNPEDQETFLQRVPFDEIGQLASNTGGVVLEDWGRDRLQLTFNVKASVQMECAEAKVAGQNLLIRAYGPEREIFNYHNLVGELLERDLASLESSVRPFSLFFPTQRSLLIRNTNRFLASEVNALIVEKAASQTKGESAALASDRVTDVVDEEYVRRADVALAKAMPIIHGGLVLPMLPGVMAVMTLLFLFGRKQAFVLGSISVKIMILMVLAGLLWLGAERLAQYKLQLVLEPHLYTRLNRQFAKRRIWYRLMMVAGFVFAWYASLIIVRWVLYIRFGTPLNFMPNDSGWFWR